MATTTYREAGRFVSRVSPSYKDPAQVVFESIPSDAASASSASAFDVEYRRTGNPEAIPYGDIRESDETRAARQRIAGTNPYNWPMKATVSNPYSWPMKPPTDSPVVAPRPPKSPSTTYEIAVDEVPPLRPVKSGSFGRPADEDRSDNANVRPATSMSSVTNSRPLAELSTSRSVTRTTQGSPPGRRMPPPPSVTREGNVVFGFAPSPPLPSSSSAEPVRRSQPILNASIQPVASARPFINTHIRPLSNQSLVAETPVVEAGSPMTPHTGLDSSSPRFPPPASQASSSPPGSPPPPYSNVTPTTRRSRNLYYAMAEARSDQIMSNPSPPRSTRHSLSKDMPSSTSSAPTMSRAIRVPSLSSPSPPIQVPRPLSAALSVRTDDSLGNDTMDPTLQAPQSAPLSVFAESLPLNSPYPGAHLYRPTSAASAPAEEMGSRVSSSSPSYPMFNNHGRSYSIPATMVEDVSDLTLRPTESAPDGIRRKPVPLGTKVTDTYKEAVVMESPSDTLKEATFRAPLRRPPRDGVREINIDQGIAHRPRPHEIRSRLTDTSKEIVPNLPVQTQVQSPSDTSKEFVPDSPVENQIQVSSSAQPMSHLEMIRKKNMERKQAGKRRLRVVNA